MIEPVELSHFFVSFFSAALVILAGGAYAILLAFSRLRHSRRLMVWAYVSYFVLIVSVFALADALSLNGFWGLVVAIMLIGYFLAPRLIWRLCDRTHANAPSHES